MKKIILLTVLLFLILSFGTEVLAQGIELPDPGLTPDSPFYFLDTLGEKIGMFFTFGAEKKSEKALKYAEEKLAEVKIMAERNKTKALEKANKNYQGFLSLANQKTQEAKEKGRNVEELATLITEKTLKHQEILAEVFEKVPEEAQKAIQKAIEVSRKGSEEAVQAVTGAKKEELQQKIEEVKTKMEKVRETVDWNIYNNYTFSYKIKYPDNFFTAIPSSLSDNKNTSFKIVSQVAVTIQIGQNPEKLSAIDWIERSPDYISFFIRGYKDTIEMIDINEKECARVFSVTQFQGHPMEQWTHTVIPFGTRTVVISKVEEDKSYNLEQIYQQMLYTFDFIDATADDFIDETADWKVYKNEEYGFEVKYPDRVFVVEFGPEYYAKTYREYWEKYQKKDWERIGKLVKIWMPADDGTANPLSAAIHIFKETVFLGTPISTSLNDYSRLHSFVEKTYGTPRYEKEKECYIDNRAAIEIRYITPGEHPTHNRPVSKIFTSNNGLLYHISCGSETGQYCDLMFSTFKFIERKSDAAILLSTPIMLDMTVYAAAGKPYTINWKAVSKATNYIIERYSNSTFSYPKIVFSRTLNSFSETLSPSVSTMFYFRFRVKACNKYGCSSWSEATKLRVERAVPEALIAPVLTDPGVSVNKHESFTLNWTSIEGAKRYWLQRATSTNFSIPAWPAWYCETNSNTDNPGVGTSAPEVTTTYYYRVKADKGRECSPWSNVVDMQVIVPLTSTTITIQPPTTTTTIELLIGKYYSPEKTFSVMVKAMEEGNIDAYLECLTKESQEMLKTTAKLTSGELRVIVERYKEAEFEITEKTDDRVVIISSMSIPGTTTILVFKKEKGVWKIDIIEPQRDVKRATDLMGTLRRGALEFYYSQHGGYPVLTDTSEDGEFLKVLIDEGYLDEMLLDPLHPKYFYEYEGTENSYTLKCYCEIEGGYCDMVDGVKDNVLTTTVPKIK